MTRGELKDIIKECYREMQADNMSITESKTNYKSGVFSGDLKNAKLKDEKDILTPKLKSLIQKIWSSDAKKKILDQIDTNFDNWYRDDYEDENGEIDENKYKKVQNKVNKLAIELLDLVSISNRDDKISVEFWINNFYNNKNSNEFFGGHSMNIIYHIDENYNFKVSYGPSLAG